MAIEAPAILAFTPFKKGVTLKRKYYTYKEPFSNKLLIAATLSETDFS
jgi:hypothetical protein